MNIWPSGRRGREFAEGQIALARRLHHEVEALASPAEAPHHASRPRPAENVERVPLDAVPQPTFRDLLEGQVLVHSSSSSSLLDV